MNENLRKTKFLLQKYNYGLSNFNFEEFKEKNPIIYDCYMFETEKLNFIQIIENNCENIKIENKKSYFKFQEIKNEGYLNFRNLPFSISDSVKFTETSHDFTIVGIQLVNDQNDFFWNKFLESGNSGKVTIISKYFPEVEDFVDFKVSTMQKIILALYKRNCTMKTVVVALSKHPAVSKKFSKNSIRKFVYENSLFFLYWGILYPFEDSKI